MLDLVSVHPQNRYTHITTPFKFAITLDSRISDIDCEFSVVYGGSPNTEIYDQILVRSMIGPIIEGRIMFELECEPVKVDKLSYVFGVTSLIVIGKYCGREFIRIGYFVRVGYPGIRMEMLEDEVMENTMGDDELSMNLINSEDGSYSENDEDEEEEDGDEEDQQDEEDDCDEEEDEVEDCDEEGVEEGEVEDCDEEEGEEENCDEEEGEVEDCDKEEYFDDGEEEDCDVVDNDAENAEEINEEKLECSEKDSKENHSKEYKEKSIIKGRKADKNTEKEPKDHEKVITINTDITMSNDNIINLDNENKKVCDNTASGVDDKEHADKINVDIENPKPSIDSAQLIDKNALVNILTSPTLKKIKDLEGAFVENEEQIKKEQVDFVSNENEEKDEMDAMLAENTGIRMEGDKIYVKDLVLNLSEITVEFCDPPLVTPFLINWSENEDESCENEPCIDEEPLKEEAENEIIPEANEETDQNAKKRKTD